MYTAIDVASRFVVSLNVGKRDAEVLKETVADFADRTGGLPPALITTDDCNTSCRAAGAVRRDR